MSEPTPLLEVIAVDADDARAAVAGGADRLELVSEMRHAGFAPSVETFEAVRAAVTIPVRVMIRRREGFSSGGVQGVAELVHTAEALRRAGAEEFVLGWLDPDGTVDIEAVRAVLDTLGGAKWTFHKAIDATNLRDAVYDAVRKLPGLDTVLSSGGFPAAGDGTEVLAAEAERERVLGGPRVLVGGGLTPEAVPGLRAAGLDAFHVGTAVRADGTWESPVDVEKVAEWRKLLG
ncbi:MAG: copper homeostasis protein CutC [Catenulispora sp.]|nr:copper homeostasis protein CutC [Catenulispora sp.]